MLTIALVLSIGVVLGIVIAVAMFTFNFRNCKHELSRRVSVCIDCGDVSDDELYGA